jgi:hypothetical protein
LQNKIQSQGQFETTLQEEYKKMQIGENQAKGSTMGTASYETMNLKSPVESAPV